MASTHGILKVILAFWNCESTKLFKSSLPEFSNNKIIYGVNTGFGPMAQYKIKDSERIQLQYNLIRSHASGTGNPIPEMYVKALTVRV